MKYFCKFLLLIRSYIFLISCGNNWSEFKKTMSGQKVTNTDEFLIKKKDPLILPPEFEKLPLPNTKKNNNEKNSVETALGSLKNKAGESKASSQLEDMILKELKK